jgi:hypothetical protein
VEELASCFRMSRPALSMHVKVPFGPGSRCPSRGPKTQHQGGDVGQPGSPRRGGPKGSTLAPGASAGRAVKLPG